MIAPPGRSARNLAAVRPAAAADRGRPTRGPASLAAAARSILRVGAVAVATTMAAVAVASGVAAQPAPEPTPRAGLSPPPVRAKSPSTGRVQSCSSYGAGFVRVPGTGACIKIGGSVTMEGTAGRGQ